MGITSLGADRSLPGAIALSTSSPTAAGCGGRGGQGLCKAAVEVPEPEILPWRWLSHDVEHV